MFSSTYKSPCLNGHYNSLQGFVISVTMLRELLDDIRRYKRDKEVNSQSYKKLTPSGETFVPSSDLHVGDIIIMEKVGSFV